MRIDDFIAALHTLSQNVFFFFLISYLIALFMQSFVHGSIASFAQLADDIEDFLGLTRQRLLGEFLKLAEDI